MWRVLVILLAGSTAYADRDAVIAVSGTISDRDATVPIAMDENYGGARASLSFVPTVPTLAGPVVTADVVPELYLGFVGKPGQFDNVLGAGLRLELGVHHESPRESVHVAFYLAARGEAIGDDKGGELMAGSYIRASRHVLVGAEVGAWFRRHADTDPAQTTSSIACSLYVGWAL